MSQRQAAKALGIHQSTLSRDLMQHTSKDDAECITAPQIERTANIPSVMKLSTLADVRDLVEKHLPEQ